MGHFTCSLMLFAQQFSQTRPPAEDPPMLSPWLMGLIVMAVLGAPFLAGSLIARWLKMKETATKFGVILLAIELGLAPFVSQYGIEALERRQHAKEMAVYEEKQAGSGSLTDEDVAEFKKTRPDVTIIRRKKAE